MTPEQFTLLQQQLWIAFGPVVPWLAMAFLILGLWAMFLLVMLLVAREIAQLPN